MSEADDFGFAPPPFRPADALVALKRSLRDLKLVERGNGFELGGKRVLEITVEDGALGVRLARRLSATPEWDVQRLRSGADQRKWLDDVKARLARWARDD